MKLKTLHTAFVILLLTCAGQAQSIKNAIPDVARPLPLSDVRVTGGPLKRAQNLNAEYLLKLEPDRMMAYYRKRAGLEPKAQGYPGWDGDGRNLTGHIAGHYLSGVSLMFAATGDRRFKERADYIVMDDTYVQFYEHLPASEHGVVKQYYEDLFAERLGFRLMRTFKVYPRLGGIDINDDGAELTFRLFDHPRVFVFVRSTPRG